VVEPPPAQKPHPPLWVAAGSAASIRRAAVRGFNLILDQYAGPELIAERIALYKAERASHGLSFDPMQVAVARQLYVAKDEADRAAALQRQAAYTRRTVEVSRPPADASGSTPGSHVLAYADRAGGTEEHALFGTPDQIRAMLKSLQQAGAHYVLLTFAGGMAQLQRFGREIMPAFSRPADAPQAAE
jgi:alkanesulfonate monooxygenase SsuD/methylene tetrahydromethanopterin reductase-like flavin-dependent oxidoreductase (luciferase family)